MIGLGLGLTLSAARAQIFDLAHLFTSGSGFCYPLSPGTLWQDAAGTLPVTADGQVVGFAQDASEGLALGPELVVDGGFNDPSKWVTGTGFSVAGGLGVANAAASGRRLTDLNPRDLMPAGTVLRIEYTVTDITAGAFLAILVSDTAAVTTGTVSRSAPGTYVEYLTATGWINGFGVRAAGTTTGSIDNISVREVLGNHATQPGSASIRPTYKTNPTRLSFDGSDDRLVSTLNPTPAGTIACRFQTSTAGRVMIGSQGATDGRCYLGIGSDGRLAAGIGAAGMTTITGGTDIRGTGWHSGAVTWDQTTVKLYLDGAEVYSGAQSGAVNTTIPMAIGALNANGTQNSFFGGDILANPIALDYAATPAQIAQMHQAWSNQT